MTYGQMPSGWSNGPAAPGAAGAGPGGGRRRRRDPASIFSQATTDVNAWVAALAQNATSASASTKAAVLTAAVALENAGIYSKISRWNPMCGDDLTACRIPVKIGAGSIIDAVTGFVAGNYTENLGLLGAANKFLDTGATPAASGLTSTSGHIWAYAGAAVNTNGCLCGAATTGSGTAKIDMQSGPNIAAQIGTGGATGRGGDRRGGMMANTLASSINAYRIGESLVTATTTSSGAVPTHNFYIGALNTDGTAGTFSGARLCGYAFGSGLTKSEAMAYDSTMQALQTTLGRQFTEPALGIWCWGDSLTATRYPSILRTTFTTRQILDRGVTGETSTQIKARFEAEPAGRTKVQILCLGRNNFTAPTTILAELRQMVATIEAAQGVAAGQGKIILTSPTNARATAAENNTGASYHFFTTDTRDVILADPILSPYYKDIRATWIAAFDPGTPQDVTDNGLDVPPSTLCQDTIHTNVAGYTVWANAFSTIITNNGW